MTYKEKLEEEHRELFRRCEQLYNFINCSPTFKDLSIEEQADMKEQLQLMMDYEKVLSRRLNRIRG